MRKLQVKVDPYCLDANYDFSCEGFTLKKRRKAHFILVIEWISDSSRMRKEALAARTMFLLSWKGASIHHLEIKAGWKVSHTCVECLSCLSVCLHGSAHSYHRQMSMYKGRAGGVFSWKLSYAWIPTRLRKKKKRDPCLLTKKEKGLSPRHWLAVPCGAEKRADIYRGNNNCSSSGLNLIYDTDVY